MSRMIRVEAETASVEYFGRFDLRINRLIAHLAAEGKIENTTDQAFANAIGRTAQCVNYWRNMMSFPNSVSLIKIGKTFEVSLDWLCGFYSNSLSECYRDKEGPKAQHLTLAA